MCQQGQFCLNTKFLGSPIHQCLPSRTRAASAVSGSAMHAKTLQQMTAGKLAKTLQNTCQQIWPCLDTAPTLVGFRHRYDDSMVAIQLITCTGPPSQKVQEVPTPVPSYSLNPNLKQQQQQARTPVRRFRILLTHPDAQIAVRKLSVTQPRGP